MLNYYCTRCCCRFVTLIQSVDHILYFRLALCTLFSPHISFFLTCTVYAHVSLFTSERVCALKECSCVFVCVWSSSGLAAECWPAWCNLTNTMRADGMGWNPAMSGSVSGVLKAAGVTVEHRSTHISHQPTPLWLLVCCQRLMLRNHCRSQANTIIEGGNPETGASCMCVYIICVRVCVRSFYYMSSVPACFPSLPSKPWVRKSTSGCCQEYQG